jgi:hypothetical protein
VNRLLQTSMTARGPGELAVHAKASVHQSTLPRLARHGGASISARTRRKSFESKILLTTCVRAGQEGWTIVYLQPEDDNPSWRSSGVVWACSGLRLRRDTALVTRAQVSAACFDLLSHLAEFGGVFCWVHLFLFRVCLCGGVRFDVFCTNASSSYMT